MLTQRYHAPIHTTILDNQRNYNEHQFYERIKNLTDINFNDSEVSLLNKGLKHNIMPKYNKQTYTRNLLEIENAILRTDKQHQDEIRACIITDINTKTNRVNMNKQTTSTTKLIALIKKKLEDNEALITKADKGNTVVVMYRSQYNDKIDEYIGNHNISILTKDPTNTYHKIVNSTINKSTILLNKFQIHSNKMIKPTAPVLTGLPKIHKPNIPIRPLINFTTSPSYKIAKFVNIWLNDNIKLSNNTSIKNNMELVDKIRSVSIPHGAKFASFDIVNMYSNIPIEETLRITKDLLIQNQVEIVKVDEVMGLLKIITSQNYFQHNNKFHTQNDGLPMGSPLSGTLANIYLNYFERTYVNNNNNKYFNNLLYWHRYVDDILVLFNGTHRQLNNMHKYLNSRHDKINFTLELETDKSINFLDLNIKNIDHQHNFRIFRKPTQTDHTIHFSSNHPIQHKHAAYEHMLNRLNNIPMNEVDYEDELYTITQIAKQNGYTENLIHRINRRILNKNKRSELTTFYTEENDKKYITLNFNKSTSHIVSKIFKKYKYKIAHKTNHNIQQKLKSSHKNDIDSGVYKLTCNDCERYYIGQSGRSFKTRFSEHIQEIKNAHKKSDLKSNYAHHLHTEKHTYTNYSTNLTILHKLPKGGMMDRMEEYEIYKQRHDPNILNEKVNTRANKIYDHLIYSRY